ncbi:MAG: hypothetical protein ACREIL_01875 [Nitrospiraceae bacterium]
MVPVKKWPWWLNTPTQLAVMFVIYLAFLWKTELGTGGNVIAALVINIVVGYLWCAEDRTGRSVKACRTGRSVKACRTIEAGDPRPWQLWRWMDIFGPSVVSRSHEELYLRRLYLLRTPWFGVMLHWIKREDWDRYALHDHPWEFWRFIVWGGYTEQVAWPYVDNQDGSPGLTDGADVTHKRFRLSKFPTGAFHCISSVKPGTVSFVINGKKNNSWGFFVPGTGKVPWRDYVDGAR